MSLAHKILKSSVWIYIGQWFNRLIGLVSTIILARILTIEDFGIVASVAIVTSVFHVISATGANKYLLRKSVITNDDYNTAWTIGVILKGIVFLGIFLSSSTVASFFNEERLTPVLQVASLIPFIRSFSNIGMVQFEKNMNYKPGFILGLFTQCVVFIIKIILAIVYESYWAFVLSELIGTVFFTLGSYYFSKYRPLMTLKEGRQQWDFSKWVLAKGFFTAIRYKIDNILIAKFFSTPVLGVYTVAKDLATIPAGQVIKPVMQPIYVGLAKHIDTPEEFADKIHKIALSIAIITLPISVGTMAISDSLVKVVLGHKWLHAIPILEVITLILLSGALNDLFSTTLTVMGKVKSAFILDIIFGITTVTLFVSLVSMLSIVEFAWLRVGFGYSVAILTLIYIWLISSVSLFRILTLIIIPILLSIIMYFSIASLSSMISLSNQFMLLIVQIVTGATVYGFSLVLVTYLIKNKVAEFSFIWQTFFLPITKKFIHRKAK